MKLTKILISPNGSNDLPHFAICSFVCTTIALTKIDNNLTKIVFNNTHRNIFIYFCSHRRWRIFVLKKSPRFYVVPCT